MDPLEIVGGIAIGEGVGGAIEDVVRPRLQTLANSQWRAHTDKPLAPADAALASVKQIVTNLNLPDQAAQTGYGTDQFDALKQNLYEYPAVAELLELWRRERLTKDDVALALRRHGIPSPYSDAILDLFLGRLDPAIIATAIQRGIMRDPGFLPVGPPTATGKVPAFPPSKLDPLLEAQAHGIDAARLFVETAIVGLPLSLQEAASAYFRGIIDLPDFERAVAEGNTRNEWGPSALEQARQILTASQYAELELRGFLTTAERRALTAKHGMSDADSDYLYDVLGRSINVHQIVTGEARGGTYNGSLAGIPPVFLASMQRGNLRPEYYNLAYANRYTLPSAFVIRALLRDGAIPVDRGTLLLEEIGWPPDLAQLVASHYGTTTSATADPHAAKAQGQLWTTAHRSYIAEEIDAAAATSALEGAGVPAGAVSGVLAVWNQERALIRKQLTPAQIKKALRRGSINAATGAAWTIDEALAELIQRGYSLTDAQSYLNIP